MAIRNIGGTDSTGYVYFERFGREIRYTRTYLLVKLDDAAVNKGLPNHPKVRKNKRDNFKKHNQ